MTEKSPSFPLKGTGEAGLRRMRRGGNTGCAHARMYRVSYRDRLDALVQYYVEEFYVQTCPWVHCRMSSRVSSSPACFPRADDRPTSVCRTRADCAFAADVRSEMALSHFESVPYSAPREAGYPSVSWHLIVMMITTATTMLGNYARTNARAYSLGLVQAKHAFPGNSDEYVRDFVMSAVVT